ncbi:MAG: WG repeat-containing protein, partial [Rhodothermales bacterium]|nr:WG repeat-containing protein [Rhodothermales bacterium]
DGQWGFVDSDGSMAIPPRYSDARPFSEGLAAVEDVDGWVYINRRGEVAISPSFAIEFAGDFSEGFAAFATAGGWGYLDKNGSPAISPQFDSAGPFSEGLAAVGSELVGYIDTAGRLVIPNQFREGRPFSDGLAAVRLNNQWTYVNRRTGTITIELEFYQAEDFIGGVARVKTGNSESERTGYIDRNGDYIWYPTN